MKILVHICCAPCAIVPVETLGGSGFTVMGYFYRHNIHPYTECMRRQDTLTEWDGSTGLRVICQEGYDMEGFIRNVVFREADRCTYCYHDRLRATALVARKGKFDCFTTTLLYSKFQKHDLIRSMGEAAGKSAGVPFHYVDFRKGWKEGIARSKEAGMYRQQYCGCIYSEKERYYRRENR